MNTTLITGASGLIGTRLTELLLQQGQAVAHLGRQTTGHPAANRKIVPSFVWDIGRGYLDPAALAATSTIVHLAGAGVADHRWTAQRKAEILNSRIDSTRLLFRSLQQHPHQVTTVVAASAIGYYGFSTGDEWIDEHHAAGRDFLAQVTQAWEAETDKLETLGLRVVKLRIGIVLSDRGGALVEMARPVRWGVGAPLGSGRQYLSWIHLDDLCRQFLFAAHNPALRGAFNAVGIAPVRNRDFMQALARTLKRPLWWPPIPAFVLRLLVGEMANMIVGGNRVSSKKMQDAGFQFDHTDLQESLEHLLKKK